MDFALITNAQNANMDFIFNSKSALQVNQSSSHANLKETNALHDILVLFLKVICALIALKAVQNAQTVIYETNGQMDIILNTQIKLLNAINVQKNV